METAEIREATKTFNPTIDFDASLTLYYDETNNIKKLHLKKGDFNVDYTANFVLGGYAYNGAKPNLDDVFNGIALQPTVNEVKLKHIATGEFDDCLKSQKLKTFLTNISSKPIYLHISTLNLFYYSLVDIVDSALPPELMIYNRDFKNVLYVACKRHIDTIIPLFVKYTYPNVPHESVEYFVDELMGILEPCKADPQIGVTLTKLDSLLREAAEEDSLPFITDEEDHMLIKGLMELYARSIYLYANSNHVFDNEGEIKEQLENFPMLNNGQPLANYSFLDSKDDKLIQVSDVTIGLFGKLFKYINTKSHEQIIDEISKMSQLQLENLDLLLGLMEKTIGFNQGLLHYIDGHEETSKIALVGRLRGKSVEAIFFTNYRE